MLTNEASYIYLSGFLLLKTTLTDIPVIEQEKLSIFNYAYRFTYYTIFIQFDLSSITEKKLFDVLSYVDSTEKFKLHYHSVSLKILNFRQVISKIMIGPVLL